MNGNAGPDRIEGGAGNDHLNGGQGNDTLTDRSGAADVGNGGAGGADRCSSSIETRINCEIVIA